MKKTFISAFLLASAIAFAACQKEDGGSVKSPKDAYFDFATTDVKNINVNYLLNGYNHGVSFEVYAENPDAISVYDGVEAIVGKRDDIKPIFKGITSKEGAFSGKMSIPSYLEKVYIHTDYLGLPSTVEVPVNGNSVSFDMKASVVSRAVSRATHTLPAGYYGFNGSTEWDDATGLPAWIDPANRVTLPDGLLADINKTLPAAKSLFNNAKSNYLLKTGANHNIVIKEATDVEMVFLSYGGSMNNVVGYYHYETANPPQTPADVARKIIVYPMGKTAGKGGGLVAGDCVKLKYWTGTEYVDTFPAGTTIGFFLTPSGYSTSAGTINSKVVPHYSNAELNYVGSTTVTGEHRQQSIALYNYTDKRDLVVISFEDQYCAASDHDYNDQIFYINVDKDNIVIPPPHKDDDMDPDPDPDPKPYYIDYEGTLAFEDLWPNKGDYDMNDVGVTYASRVYFDVNNKVTKVEDCFTPARKGAAFQNGFGYQYGVAPSAVKSMTLTTTPSKALPSYATDGKGLEAGQSLATVMLFSDINEEVQGPAFARTASDVQKAKYVYNITTVFEQSQDQATVGFPPYNPFLVIKHEKYGQNVVDPRNRELHLPFYHPTDLAYKKDGGLWFGKYDDRSDEAKGWWYVSDESYPFAINVPTKSFNFPLESQRIDAVYPQFKAWAASHGETNKDWYK